LDNAYALASTAAGQPFAQGVGAGVSQNGSTASSGIMPSGAPAMAISKKHMFGL
jgi:hypothetical protein